MDAFLRRSGAGAAAAGRPVMAVELGVRIGCGLMVLGLLVGVVAVVAGRRKWYVLPYHFWSLACGVWAAAYWPAHHWWAAAFLLGCPLFGVLSGMVRYEVRRLEGLPPRRWACPCGEWHELSKGAEEIIRDHGPYVLIPRGNETYVVPRVWIAAHGLRGFEVALLARQYGWAWMRVEYHVGGE